MNAKTAVRKALENGLVVPAFNIPYPPMLKPVAQAIADENSVAMIQVARLEWEKFESVSLENIAEEYGKYAVEGHTLLHLDHVPVIDEDHLEVDYLPIIRRAIAAGYQSVPLRSGPRPCRRHPRGGRVGRGDGPRDQPGVHPL